MDPDFKVSPTSSSYNHKYKYRTQYNTKESTQHMYLSCSEDSIFGASVVEAVTGRVRQNPAMSCSKMLSKSFSYFDLFTGNSNNYYCQEIGALSLCGGSQSKSESKFVYVFIYGIS